MALDPGKPLPFGLYSVLLIPMDPDADDSTTGSTDPDDYVNLGYARSVAITIDSTSVQNEGNDQVLATETFDEKGTANVEQAGLNINSLGFIWGQEVTSDGDTPNQITSISRDVSVTRPHFVMKSLSRSSRGGTFETTILNAQANGGPNLTQGYGVFGNATVPVTFTPNEAMQLIQVAEYETAPDYSPPPPPSPPPSPPPPPPGP